MNSDGSDDDADEAQARLLLGALNEHVERCTNGIETADRRASTLRAEGARAPAEILESESRSLRAELYEVSRHIDRLVQRFPTVRR
ncbi:hypothetical protein GCM10007304_37280 [Rhodococcoides trifolii]|uniref:Uncharacterized protein n=1 Tax=Rhodococcoides trifolii TaxID=908250 RepID=A0A917G2U0_9NOCA|nr:hypothetical protein [Rhodococcus trifolii]GGG19928.1 hypothetical protein GCM10007304_37280 [Rhodococcus trifolii]